MYLLFFQSLEFSPLWQNVTWYSTPAWGGEIDLAFTWIVLKLAFLRTTKPLYIGPWPIHARLWCKSAFLPLVNFKMANSLEISLSKVVAQSKSFREVWVKRALLAASELFFQRTIWSFHCLEDTWASIFGVCGSPCFRSCSATVRQYSLKVYLKFWISYSV